MGIAEKLHIMPPRKRAVNKKSKFKVEKIVNRVKVFDTEFAQIIWKGYPYSDNTWESVKRLIDQGFVTSTEVAKVKFSQLVLIPRATIQPIDLKEANVNLMEGVEYGEIDALISGKEIEKVVGISKEKDGVIKHLVKWKNNDEMNVLPASFTNHKFPDQVIEFYQNRIKFRAPTSTTSKKLFLDLLNL